MNADFGFADQRVLRNRTASVSTLCEAALTQIVQRVVRKRVIVLNLAVPRGGVLVREPRSERGKVRGRKTEYGILDLHGAHNGAHASLQDSAILWVWS